MRITSEQTRLSATDLSNHLACRHLTSLDLSVARGKRSAPEWNSPDLVVIQQLGLRHEAAYLRFLQDKGLSFADLREIKDESQALAETLAAMERGVEVIAQGSLAAGRWFGRPDVLARVAIPSRLGDWSYEVFDCKLARETKAATILQLALYSALLGEIQGQAPDFMYVIPTGKNFEAEPYRFAEYSAYYRYVKARLENASDRVENLESYPEPCTHCDVCRWFRECDAQRRGDDHLSLVAGITRLQRKQLNDWQTETLSKLAALPIPLQRKPLHGSREGYERVREQARLQFQARVEQTKVHELLPVTPGTGFCSLPEPSDFDVFMDLEGDPFADDGGRQYLFGFVTKNEKQEFIYKKQWCFTAEEEKRSFEWIVDQIMQRWKADRNMHVYHFGAYEPSKFKWLMGRYATREDEIDRMLRARLFVDLHTTFKQAVRAGVEEYSLKKLEMFHEFERKIPLEVSREAMRYVEHRLELGWDGELPENLRLAMEGYNEDDCRSTASLRNWLETQRKKLTDSGSAIPRPHPADGAPTEELDERQKRVAALVECLIAGVPVDPLARSEEEAARWMLAHLLDWHRRENKACWWEGFRLSDLDDEQLLDERVALAGLKFVERIAIDNKIPVDQYAFEKQETEVRADRDLYHRGKKFGCVVSIDPVQRTINIRKMKKTGEFHPSSVYMWDAPLNTVAQTGSLCQIGEWVAKNGIDAPGPYRAGRDLLLRRPPRLAGRESLAARASETPENTASRVVLALQDSAFAIQGPPGSGKTHTGARMICELLKKGKKIGVTALGHRVIRNLLEKVVEAAQEMKVKGVRCMHRENDGEESGGIAIAKDNDEASEALRSGSANVMGGTSWLWSREQAFETVDVLFIDEAGQMSLADVLAVSQAAKRLALLGDPQQLDQPVKGSHPAGAEKSALEHLLDGRKTIPDNMGFLLPLSWRLHPEICKFTSEVFYEDKLSSHPIARSRVLQGHAWLTGAGLWSVPVEHNGNRNSCAEEVEIVARIVAGLLTPEVRWFRSAGDSRQLEEKDILIVAPYNAQVADLSARLPKMRIGTVDKFQGQEAPVVIYSLTTSSPEDAPRGMEFLYSLNRLNVATSRAMSNVIVVGNPRLFEPECHSPRQMQLANALCRYRELATIVPSEKI
jgi:predicted RecB family nuclease